MRSLMPAQALLRIFSTATSACSMPTISTGASLSSRTPMRRYPPSWFAMAEMCDVILHITAMEYVSNPSAAKLVANNSTNTILLQHAADFVDEIFRVRGHTSTDQIHDQPLTFAMRDAVA